MKIKGPFPIVGVGLFLYVPKAFKIMRMSRSVRERSRKALSEIRFAKKTTI
jgi:hypothetical protein